MGEFYVMRISAAVVVERERTGRTVVDDMVATIMRAHAREESAIWRSASVKPQSVVEMTLLLGVTEVRRPIGTRGRKSSLECEDIAADVGQPPAATGRLCHPLAGVGDMMNAVGSLDQIGAVGVMMSTIAGVGDN
ncbi:hypothetical protein [Mesorhizobium sp. 43Arga]